jgi:hypothetical protein
MPTFTHQGKELTAGQALDVWLAYRAAECKPVQDTHFFADAMDGFKLETAALQQAGIEIQFGEKS